MPNRARFGVNLMANHWGGDSVPPGSALLARRRALLDRMSDVGMDHVMLGDHVMFHGGLGNDGLTDAASVVSVNDDLDVYLSVYLLVLRHPLLVARQLLTVADLAPGRLWLGVGIAGDDRREVEACGIDPRTRGRRMDEALALVRALLGGERVTHAGEFYSLTDAAVVPVPHPPIPLIVGGRSDAALRRAGRHGDGWLGIWNSAARFARATAAVADHARDAGRGEVDWRHGMTFWCGFGQNADVGRARVAPVMEAFYQLPFDSFERYIPRGTPAQVADFVAPYLDAGCTTVNVIPFADSAEAAIDAAAEVRALLEKAV